MKFNKWSVNEKCKENVACLFYIRLKMRCEKGFFSLFIGPLESIISDVLSELLKPFSILG